MAEPSEIFVPAVAAPPIVEARLSAGWRVLTVAGFRAERGDTTPDPSLVVDFGTDGTTDLQAVTDALSAWPGGSDLFAEIRFVPR